VQKKNLSEADICAKFIAPALSQAGWNEVEHLYREYTLRPGRVVARGKQAARDKNSILRADYVLFNKTSIPLAVIEAKDNSHAVGAGMAQAINYAELLGGPFAFSSNGDGFVICDGTLATGPTTSRPKKDIKNILKHFGTDHYVQGARAWSRALFPLPPPPNNMASSPVSTNSATSAPSCASGSPRPVACKANWPRRWSAQRNWRVTCTGSPLLPPTASART